MGLTAGTAGKQLKEEILVQLNIEYQQVNSSDTAGKQLIEEILVWFNSWYSG